MHLTTIRMTNPSLLSRSQQVMQSNTYLFSIRTRYSLESLCLGHRQEITTEAMRRSMATLDSSPYSRKRQGTSKMQLPQVGHDPKVVSLRWRGKTHRLSIMASISTNPVARRQSPSTSTRATCLQHLTRSRAHQRRSQSAVQGQTSQAHQRSELSLNYLRCNWVVRPSAPLHPNKYQLWKQ